MASDHPTYGENSRWPLPLISLLGSNGVTGFGTFSLLVGLAIRGAIAPALAQDQTTVVYHCEGGSAVVVYGDRQVVLSLGDETLLLPQVHEDRTTDDPFPASEMRYGDGETTLILRGEEVAIARHNQIVYQNCRYGRSGTLEGRSIS